MKSQSVRVPDRLLAAISANDPISGHTHNFYRYPARFSPLVVREVIRHYSQPDDVVLDPFMGGATTIVEALAMGRRAVGVDLNTLSHFVATVKTSPLSETDGSLLREWSEDVRTSLQRGIGRPAERVRHLPPRINAVFADLMAHIDFLPMERQRQFLRCALLKTGQQVIDGKKQAPASKQIVHLFLQNVSDMMEGFRDFTACCRVDGVQKREIRKRRLLLCRSVVGLEEDRRLTSWPKAKLVITSPPYPSVHVLYHRWQVDGQKQTPAPYWLAAVTDGHFGSYYTFGSCTAFGVENYFRNVEACFRSVRAVIAPDALVIQIMGFSDADSQLPRYLQAMARAGYRERNPLSPDGQDRIWRQVPNRKWYCHGSREMDSSKEVILFHRPT